MNLTRGDIHRAHATQLSEISRIVRIKLLIGLHAAALCFPGSIRADDDFRVDSEAWNGLRAFVDLARDAGVELQAPTTIDLGALGPDDALLLVHPTVPLPLGDLAAFMRDGGRLAIADDFGTGDALLANFAIERRDIRTSNEGRRLRGNHNVLIATPDVGHPLTDGVQAVVLNHPRALHHASLDPLLSVDADSGPVVLAGAVGTGRLVAIADASVLINNMLEFAGNERFARNLLAYLASDRRLFVAVGDTELGGRYSGAEDAPALAGLREGLERLADIQLPRAALSIITFVIAAALLLFAATTLPRRSAYARSMSPAVAPTVAGLAGRLQYYSRPGRNLLPPLMTYKLELEARLQDRLQLGTQASATAVRAALSQRRLGSELVDDAARLLEELEQLQMAQERPASPPVVSAERFRAMVARGGRLLAALPASAADHPTP